MLRLFYAICIIQSIIPYTVPERIPYRITGPATVNIFAPTPRINPSAFVST